MKDSRIFSILQQIKSAIDAANADGIECDYPDTVKIDGERYSFERALICFGQDRARAICDEPAELTGEMLENAMLSDEWMAKFSRPMTEEIIGPRVITRVMDDGIKTKDGVA